MLIEDESNKHSLSSNSKKNNLSKSNDLEKDSSINLSEDFSDVDEGGGFKGSGV